MTERDESLSSAFARGEETLPRITQRFGGRYRVDHLLGRGGMGEVWRAYDLKLRTAVALKTVVPQSSSDPRALEHIRHEVRAARDVVSTNVCRVYDLFEHEDREYVTMELVDGRTLKEKLRDEAPLNLSDAQEIASQLLSGLEAIHRAGLVHRDLKPSNIMVTRSGRVVIMDFGLARTVEEGLSSVSGTPAYMAPEQARGESSDPRSDIYSVGMILAEMVAPGGVAERDRQMGLWDQLRSNPPVLPDTPWAPVLDRALRHDRNERVSSAAELLRMLEQVTARFAERDYLDPYPGLATFTVEDAEYFFGRECEIERMWRSLEEPRVHALIGPSGAGKSSFLRAGIIATAPDSWGIIITTPGDQPFRNLARALLPEIAGEIKALDDLLRFEELDVAVSLLARWRHRFGEALVIIDQFEELFVQNSPELCESFAELLGRIATEAEAHVLLSLRDDFLFHCSSHNWLMPVFSDPVPLAPPRGPALRRALVQPAVKCGYGFEDELLVDEIIAEVDGERGALPLMAFALSRLWENRDRETGLLTREAYEELGGVSGALAKHADVTLERLGASAIPVVRELFRNLVTAQGTRAARDRNELLSVFPEGERRAVSTILDALIDARLLTSYEVEELGETRGKSGRRRIELIHESLIAAWPLLVRWQTQDVEGAQLRDDLRQGAQLWSQRGRDSDYLWTGVAFRDYQHWREHYPGGLTDLEEDFAEAMETHARRRQQRLRIWTVAVLLLAIGVAGLMTLLWKRSQLSERQARDEVLRAEAAELLSRGEALRIEDPTEALAYAIASLELADTEEARKFALRLLWQAPPSLELADGEPLSNRLPAFSPNGRYLAVAGHSSEVRVWSSAGGPPALLPGHAPIRIGSLLAQWASDDLLVTGLCCGFARQAFVWTAPDWELERTIDFGGEVFWQAGDRALMVLDASEQSQSMHMIDLPEGELRNIGDLNRQPPDLGAFTPTGNAFIWADGQELHHRAIPSTDDSRLGEHPAPITNLGPLSASSNLFWSVDQNGEIQIRDLASDPARLIGTTGPSSEPATRIPDPSLQWAVDHSFFRPMSKARVWDLDGWPEARPLDLRRRASWHNAGIAFHPAGEWLVVSTHGFRRLTFWPLTRHLSTIVDGYDTHFRPLGFSPDGRWLVTGWTLESGELRLWPLPGSGEREVRSLRIQQGPTHFSELAFDPAGRFIFLTGFGNDTFLVPLDGSAPRELHGFSNDAFFDGAAVSPTGTRVATAWSHGDAEERMLRVWDTESGVDRAFPLPVPEGTAGVVSQLVFLDESTLLTAGDGGIRRWNLDDGTHELVLESGHQRVAMAVEPERTHAVIQRFDVLTGRGDVELLDLATWKTTMLEHLEVCCDPRQAMHISGDRIAVADSEGIIRVTTFAGGEPHLLVGHELRVDDLAISPDGRWVASSSTDGTLRLWPMPDLSKPPLHTLPRGELISTLKSLTNFRAVRDPDSKGGWRIELEPFPGWAEVPRW